MKQVLIVIAIFFCACQEAPTQPGCTDPQALNYDPDANVNDGSCTYPATQYTPQLIAELPAELEESSGLAFFSGRLLTHLDGGNPAELFAIDTLTAGVTGIFSLSNTVNSDWEDLAENDTWLYIGDFGNNSGSRTDLRIYRVNKAGLLAGNATPEVIEFSFSDQTDFTPAPNANNYDCEAFFFRQDSLHLFSKNWVDFKTRHYVLPATPGTHIAELRDSLDVQGQVTAADISDDGTVLLLGYNTNSSETFLWLLFDYHDTRFFSGNKRRISLGSALITSQAEGLVFRDNATGYISSERFSFLPQKLMSFSIQQYLEPPVATGEAPGPAILNLSPNPAGELLQIRFDEIVPGETMLDIFHLSGKNYFSQKISPGATEHIVDIRLLPAGPYLLQIRTGITAYSRLFLKR